MYFFSFENQKFRNHFQNVFSCIYKKKLLWIFRHLISVNESFVRTFLFGWSWPVIFGFCMGVREYCAVYYTSPQSFIKHFLIHWFNNFGEFWIVGSLGWVFEPIITIYRIIVILCIIIGNAHQFIGYCLIPLDPC